MPDVRLALRQSASNFLRRYPWLLPAAVIVTAAALALACAARAHLALQLGAAGALGVSSFLWGFSARPFRGIAWPSLRQFSRRQYAAVWDSLATSEKEATVATVGSETDRDLANLLELAAISTHDEVLEIGCGVGRVGLAIAPYCRLWTGADISSKILAHTADRLGHLGNVRLVHLHGVGLSELRDGSFDVVYSIDVFAHLDPVDRWRYVQDALRVLRPGGRLYVENIDLESDDGWAMFANHAKRWELLERPPYDTTFSTGGELMTYATRAGFEQVQAHHRPPKVIATGIRSA